MILVELYRNRDKRDVIKVLRVVWKEEKIVNRVHHWCIVLYCGDFEGNELYMWNDVLK